MGELHLYWKSVLLEVSFIGGQLYWNPNKVHRLCGSYCGASKANKRGKKYYWYDNEFETRIISSATRLVIIQLWTSSSDIIPGFKIIISNNPDGILFIPIKSDTIEFTTNSNLIMTSDYVYITKRNYTLYIVCTSLISTYAYKFGSSCTCEMRY